jgi:hypothetical protein
MSGPSPTLQGIGLLDHRLPWNMFYFFSTEVMYTVTSQDIINLARLLLQLYMHSLPLIYLKFYRNCRYSLLQDLM